MKIAADSDCSRRTADKTVAMLHVGYRPASVGRKCEESLEKYFIVINELSCLLPWLAAAAAACDSLVATHPHTAQATAGPCYGPHFVSRYFHNRWLL